MKRLILGSILSLAPVYAQEKPQIQLIPPEKLLEFPKVKPDPQKHLFPGSIEMTFPKVKPYVHEQGLPAVEWTLTGTPSEVCSVPLLQGQVPDVDHAMAFNPGNKAVPMPQARVPAPACAGK